jgi:hypothetical protein
MRGCTRELSGVRIGVDRRTANSRPVEFYEVGDREIQEEEKMGEEVTEHSIQSSI